MPGIHRPGGARHTLKLGAEGWVPSTQVGVGVVFIYLLTYLETCRILVQQPRIKTMPPALQGLSLNHWTAREVPGSEDGLLRYEGHLWPQGREDSDSICYYNYFRVGSGGGVTPSTMCSPFWFPIVSPALCGQSRWLLFSGYWCLSF